MGRLDKTSEKKTTGKAELIKDIMIWTFDSPPANVMQGVTKLFGGITQKPMLGSSQTTQMRPSVAISTKHTKTVGGKDSGDGQFNYPFSLAVTTEGDIVVADLENSRLQFLDKNGSFKNKVNLGFKPLHVEALTNGELLVTGDGNKIHVLDKQRRETRVIQLGDKGQGQQRLQCLLYVAVNSSNQIIVSDFKNHNMKIFNSVGHYLFTIGSRGSGLSQLKFPCSVTTDSEDNIIVADSCNHRVSMFSRDGRFLRHVLTKEEHGLNYPWGLAMTQNGHFVVSENNHPQHWVEFFQ
ncbi:tripartite motif-containing protein 2-like [Branchiostoma lanceolatum]|uniref:tripartite motif-containing protein 2-like n=1 Tax=Branchiostoma lanceolatum TaxID=7740 RepID=UPI0034540819